MSDLCPLGEAMNKGFPQEPFVPDYVCNCGVHFPDPMARTAHLPYCKSRTMSSDEAMSRQQLPTAKEIALMLYDSDTATGWDEEEYQTQNWYLERGEQMLRLIKQYACQPVPAMSREGKNYQCPADEGCMAKASCTFFKPHKHKYQGMCPKDDTIGCPECVPCQPVPTELTAEEARFLVNILDCNQISCQACKDDLEEVGVDELYAKLKRIAETKNG